MSNASAPDPLADVAWPARAIAAALRALADRSGCGLAADAPPTEEVPTDAEGVRTLGLRLGLELHATQATWRGAGAMLAAGPLLARLADGGALALMPARPGRVRLLTQDLRVVERPMALVRDALRSPFVAGVIDVVDRELDALQVPAQRRPRARDVLLDERLGQAPAVTGWIVRPAGARPLVSQMREAGLFQALRLMGLTLVVQYGLAALAWIMLALGALSGRVDAGWLIAWGLVLATQVPLRGVMLHATGQVALRGGAMVKRLLLLGALRGDVDQMRAHGVGGLIGRAIESEAFEALALNGGTRLLVGAWELVVALGIAAQGAGGVALVAVGLAALAGAIFVGLAYVRARDAWTTSRLAITGDLIERMVGHRTRLAQEAPADWHRGEDAALADYVERSRLPDELEAWLGVWPQRGFMAVGLLVLALAAGGSPDPLAVGLGLGGVLLGGQAIANASAGVAALAGAIVARRVVKDLVIASRRPERVGVVLPPMPPGRAAEPLLRPPGEAPPATTPEAAPVLQLSRVGFAYPGRPRPVLDDVDLTLRPGDRVLLEGGSGSGKSTLAALMAGLRVPSRGLVLLRGLDPATWGETAWRRRAVAAPQFHDNRVIAGTFAFNLLLGRGGAPDPAALAEAEALCRELGLGPLIDRMPAGLMQQVGESGWQLSHGERSRLYLARALLQDADVVLLDESFGALDPDNQGRALECALRRARTLVVIAHP
ncbi:MAG: ATP-binding cassette domain-containing protein [Deltaproteobacteria bacterium]|nr:ATP-binding cassette domain-containing protein [Deltaproteobacteria bacterium]